MFKIYFFVSLFFSEADGFTSSEWKKVPAIFECDRIYAELMIGGKKQYFFTDSGGGLQPFTYKETIQAWGLKEPKYVEGKEDGAIFVIAKIDWPSG